MTNNRDEHCEDGMRDLCRREADERHKEIREKLSGLHAAVVDVQIRQGEAIVKMNEACTRLETVNKIVTGNGAPEKGLTSRVVDLEGTVATSRKLLWVIVGAGATTIVAALFQLFETGMRHVKP